MDNDSQVLEDAALTVTHIDIEYRRADFEGKKKLKKSRDAAFSTYLIARVELLEDGVICTDDDVAKMQEIRQEIQQAGDTQTLLGAIPRFMIFLTRIGI
ncbi:MAG: hypothetical protein DSM107014_06400 [Gomphosphaeria aponina SAG 52.96 = DSM 107014]|uniref:Uncharacterized protein n=1 Tax=Gomphosphaeria aponina SAG 52.96 = DSM 107014 TaxID=1521640 RepID=A0A941GXF8_9CHRO|nr:hypothetical protein [Gomphosphaeria aponina SAG 52.96 = DSM 107014]